MSERELNISSARRPENWNLIRPIIVTDIYINLKDRDITFWAHGTLLARLSLAAEGLIFEAPEPSATR